MGSSACGYDRGRRLGAPSKGMVCNLPLGLGKAGKKTLSSKIWLGEHPDGKTNQCSELERPVCPYWWELVGSWGLVLGQWGQKALGVCSPRWGARMGEAGARGEAASLVSPLPLG